MLSRICGCGAVLVVCCLLPAARVEAQDVLSTGSELEAGPVPGPAVGPAPEKAVKLPEGVVAMVNGQPIMEKDWADTCKKVAGPSVLQGMIYYAVVQQEAKKLGVVLTDDDVTAEFDKAVNDAGGMENFTAALQQTGESPDLVRSRLRTKALLRKMVESKVKVSEEELKAVYLEIYGPRAEVQVIVTQTQPDAETAAAQAKQGADFTALVGQYSTDEMTARNHGYLPGVLTDGFFPKPYGQVLITEAVGKKLLGMKKGEVSDVIAGGEGAFYVFKITAVEPAKDTPYETVRGDIEAKAREMKLARVATEYWQDLMRAADIRVGI